MRLRARYVFPVASPPIRDGVVHIEGERIAAVGPAIGETPATDLGNVALIPGLVNAHVHLEFSDLASPLGRPGMSLPDWIRLVIESRRGRNEQDSNRAIQCGLEESLALGVTFLGEISQLKAPPAAGAPDVVAFQESLGLQAERMEPQLARAARFLDAAASHDGRPIVGVSPHAPYSAHPELVAGLVRLASSKGVPVAMHIAESREELELVHSQSGPFRDLLEDLDAWEDDAIPPGSQALDYLKLLSGAPRALVIHGNYLHDEDLAFLAHHSQRMSAIYCPRTHAFFGHAAYPLASMLARGIHVALGTDSRASNPDLSMLEEMRHVARHHPVSPEVVLRLGTIDAAKALGHADDIGTITPGKQANLAVVRLPDRDAADPHKLFLDSSGPVVTTYYRGKLQSRTRPDTASSRLENRGS